MKKIVLISVFILMLLTSCKKSNKLRVDKPVEKNLSFAVEKTTLSTGNYSLKPNVHSIKDNSSSNKFMVSLGVIESGYPIVDNVTIFNNSLNFYTSISDNYDASTISIPQILVSVDLPKDITFDDLSFNIIKSNYDTLKLGYSHTQALNNIRAEYGITSRVKPTVRIVKNDKDYLWNFSFESAFIKDSSLSPLLKLEASVNSSNGNIVKFEPETISEVVGHGYIKDFNSLHNKVVYSRSEALSENSETHVFLKNLNDYSEKLVYSSPNNLKYINLSNSSKYLAILEKSNPQNQVLIKNLEKLDSDETISFPVDGVVKGLVWSEEALYLSSSTDIGVSEISKYDPVQNKLEKVLSSDGLISSFSVQAGEIVYSTGSEKGAIHLFKDGHSRPISPGISPLFKDSETIVFLSPLPNSNKSDLLEYDLKSNSSKKILEDFSAKKIFCHNQHIYILSSGEEPDLFDLMSYDSVNMSLKRLFTFTNENIFLNFNTSRVYFSTNTGLKTSRRIYSLDI